MAGSLVDLLNILRRRFTNPHSYTKFLVLRAIAQRTGADTFVEAGTFRAVNAERCARVFRKVFTVELDAELAAAARARLATLPGCAVVEGDAAVHVPAIVARPEVGNVVILLDAHPCGEGTAEGEIADPAISMMEALAPNASKIKALLVDDFRLFGVEPGYPEKWQLVRAAEELFGKIGFSVYVFMDQLIVERTS